MRKLLLSLFLFSALSTFAQNQGAQSTIFPAVGQGRGVKVTGTGIQYHQITWYVTGGPAACSVQVDSSADGITWNSGDVIASQTCTANGSSAVANFVANYVRVDLTAFSGGSTPTVVVSWDGWVSTASNITGTLTVSGLATFRGGHVDGPGLPADATVVINGQAQWDATNHRLTLCSTTPCDSIVKVGANTADGTGVTGCGAGGVSGGSTQCVYRAGGSGVTVTVSAGTNTEGFMVSQNTSGTVDAVGSWTTAIAAGKKIAGQLASAPGGAGGTALMLLFPWSIGTTNEHVISFNLIKSGAVGVFPRVKGYSCTIYSVDVTADQSGTFAMDIWKVATAIPAAGNKISNVDGPALTAAQSSFDHVPSGWSSLVVSDGDVFGGTVGTFTTVTNVLVQIRCH